MAIHQQNYASYEGPLRQGGAWRAFARSTFRLAMSFRRTWAILIILWIPILFLLLAIFIEYGVREKFPIAQEMATDGDIGVSAVTSVLLLQFSSAALLMLVSGCGAVADDLRHRTFQLYFSRPVERWEYLLGKFLGLAALSSLVTIVPALLLSVLRAAYFARTEMAAEIFMQSAIGLGFSVAITCVVSAIVLGLSSLTSRAGYAVLGFVAILFVPQVVSIIVALASNADDAAQLWSLSGNIWLGARILLAESPPDVPLVLPFLILAVVGVLGIFAARWRVHKLEGIA